MYQLNTVYIYPVITTKWQSSFQEVAHYQSCFSSFWSLLFIYIWIINCTSQHDHWVTIKHHWLFVCHLSFSNVLFLLLKRRRSSVFLFRKTITVVTRRLTRVTRIATVMATLSADATYDNTHINTHTRTSTAENNDRTQWRPLQLGHGRQHTFTFLCLFLFLTLRTKNSFSPSI